MSQCTSGHGKQEKNLQVSQTKETIKIENKKLKLITRKYQSNVFFWQK